jgi:hypothetical protein
MDSEDWKEFQKKGKEIRQGRMKRHQQAIRLFVLENKLSFTLIKDWHIRISDGKTTLDLYPQAKRYHNLTKNKRGDYHNLKGFLTSIFGNEAKGSSAKGSKRTH